VAERLGSALFCSRKSHHGAVPGALGLSGEGGELLAKAHGDFARALNRGIEVAEPVGFTVHCAWQHTQNLLRSEERTPGLVSTEKAAELVDADLRPESWSWPTTGLERFTGRSRS
jgi:hypothetical protein